MSADRPSFLADESCDFAVVRALRAAGFDVKAVAEDAPSTPDSEVLDRARRENRILVTEDKDFGWLVFAAIEHSPGVVLLRYPATARSSIVDSVVNLVLERSEELESAFTLVQPGRIRFGFRRGARPS